MTRLGLPAALFFLCAGCDSAPVAKAAQPQAAQEAPPPAPARGLAARGNDAAVVALAKAAMTCPADPRGALLDWQCKELTAYREAKQTLAAGATLINLLEDPDLRVRYTAAIGLSESAIVDGATWRTDPALAARLVKALAHEPSPVVAEAMARRVARVDVEKTGQLEAIKAVVKERKHKSVPREILGNLLSTNSSSRATYDYFLAMTNDADPSLRYWAVTAFWVGGGQSPKETCAMWQAHLDDADPEVAGIATQHLGWYQRDECNADYDMLIARLDARLKAGKTDGKHSFATGLERLCEDEHATRTHKAKATVVAKKLAADKELHDFMRMGGLEAATKCGGKAARPFVARYTRDSSDWVANKAKELLKPSR